MFAAVIAAPLFGLLCAILLALRRGADSEVRPHTSIPFSVSYAGRLIRNGAEHRLAASKILTPAPCSGARMARCQSATER